MVRNVLTGNAPAGYQTPALVVQDLETDAEGDGLLRCMEKHLAPGGTCVLNAFKPYMAPDELSGWVVPGEKLEWEVPFEGGKLACYDRRGPEIRVIKGRPCPAA